MFQQLQIENRALKKGLVLIKQIKKWSLLTKKNIESREILKIKGDFVKKLLTISPLCNLNKFIS